MRSLARRLGNHAEAQELCQEVFLQALEKPRPVASEPCALRRPRIPLDRQPYGHQPGQVRRGPVVSAEAELIDATASETRTPLGNVLERERQSQVRAGLKRLGKLDRQTLEAFYVEGRSLLEMSDEFASPVGTIKRRLHVARKRLARELAEMA